MMNTVRKSENLLPFPVISAAANGDTTAMCAILKHYEGYIAKLCTRTLKDDAGNTYSYVDEEMRNRLQVRHGRKFCVSDFRQTQEYHSYNVHNRGEYPCPPLSPSGWNGMRAGTA